LPVGLRRRGQVRLGILSHKKLMEEIELNSAPGGDISFTVLL
jgi:hypothetical protein